MTEKTIEPEGVDHWTDDVLGRKSLADFLTESISEQARQRMSSRGDGLTVALDSDWGTGKSFFIQRWAKDLRSKNFPVIVFDAWENDIGDEASIALMAAIRDELDKWSDKLSINTKIRNQAREATNSAIKGLRHAIVPTSKVIASSLIKKTTGIAVDEIIESFTGSNKGTLRSISDAASSTLESGLDEIFKDLLEEHKKRSVAITAFKKSMSELVGVIEVNLQCSVPVFVFIDEVDRCRPTYAIKLLEEIKHIFGVPKFCFVVSTTLEQLRESVCAIYGSGFDSHRYLKRFFDRQYALPEPDGEEFSAQLLRQSESFSQERCATGLPPSADSVSVAKVIALVARALSLDLRSQKQVFDIATSVAAAIPKERKIFALWLFFLSALQHSSPSALRELSANKITHAEFKEICKRAGVKSVLVDYKLRMDPFGRQTDSASAELIEIAWLYYQWSNRDLKNLREEYYSMESHSYPESNLSHLIEEMPSSYMTNKNYPASISMYVLWVRYSGLNREP